MLLPNSFLKLYQVDKGSFFLKKKFKYIFYIFCFPFCLLCQTSPLYSLISLKTNSLHIDFIILIQALTMQFV